MRYEYLLVTDEAGVRTIALNRPASLNALNYDVMDELEQAIFDSGKRDHVRAVVIRGEGRAFCAGDDLKGMGTEKNPVPEDIPLRRAELGYTRLLLAIRKLPKPVLAQVHGYALGAGFDIALACDMIFASSDAKFGFPFIKRGLLGGTAILPTIVGYHKACELLFGGEMLTAEEARQMGIVNVVTPPEQLAETVADRAGRLARSATGQIGMMKMAVNQSIGEPLDKSVQFQRYVTALMYGTHDCEEGKRAFVEKREPNFIGK
jgi:enoyl-CoA hydratase/carnithine racemase